MSKATAFSFADLKPVSQGVLILLAEEGAILSGAGKALDKTSGGAISRAVKQRKFKGDGAAAASGNSHSIRRQKDPP